MKISKRMYAPAIAAAAILTGPSCSTDWGQTDPPAGVQTAPKLENVATFEFEDEFLDEMLFRLHANADIKPALTVDEPKGNVLELNDGWVEINNPLCSVTCEKAVSLTFWMKQMPAVITDDDGNETTEAQDITSPLFAFTNANDTQHFTFSANGWLNYDGVDGPWSDNDPAVYPTGYIKPDVWNYIALCVRETGYDLYVNGEKKVCKDVTDFECSRLVAFMNNAAYFSIGSSENHSRWRIDDLRIYRNAITAKEIARPTLPGESGGGDIGPDLSKWILVGLEDNTTPFWSNWAPYVTLEGDGTINYEFYNYNGGATNNWCNWLICFANAERGADGYAEYAVIRSDAYGWGSNYNGDNISHDFNWDTFMSEMDGAKVNLTINRMGEDVDMTAVVLGTSGTTYTYKYSMSGVTSEKLVTFLFAEGSHLLLNPEGCFIGTNYEPALAVGPDDFSAAWWTTWSPLEKCSGDFTQFGYILTNHEKDGAANWNNWVLVCTNGKYVGDPDGYAENFVLRSDAYGWGNVYNGDNITHNYNWDTFTADMRDAHVQILMERAGDDFTMIAHQTRADGSAIPDYGFSATIDAATVPDLGFFFVLDGNWLEIHKVGYFPFLSMNPQN